MNYYEENRNALDILHDGVTRVRYHGIDTIIKPIPHPEDGRGIDPVLAEINRNDKQMEVFHALEAKYGGNPPPQAMREAELDNTLDLTDVSIRISEKSVPTDTGNVKLLVYNREDQEGLRPIILFIHGGAFTGGSLQAVHNYCKLLCQMHNAVVVNVEYRLAPENPFPAGFNDCWSAVCWVHEHAAELGGDSSRLIISGDSAGGNLSAGCAQRDRNEGTGYIHGQVLLYPAVLVGSAETDDYHWNIDQYEFRSDREEAEKLARALQFSDQFLPFVYMNRPGPITDPYASPLFGSTEGLPKAIVMTSEYDYLRPQAESYVRGMIRSGVEVKYILYKGCAHATISHLGHLPQAYDIAREYAPFID